MWRSGRGKAPDEPDNVVQPMKPMQIGLYASKDYVAAQGLPKSLDDLDGHEFVLTDNLQTRAPFSRWLLQRIKPAQIVFSATDVRVMRDAILAGAGIGFMALWEAERFDGVVPVSNPLDVWEPLSGSSLTSTCTGPPRCRRS